MTTLPLHRRAGPRRLRARRPGRAAPHDRHPHRPGRRRPRPAHTPDQPARASPRRVGRQQPAAPPTSTPPCRPHPCPGARILGLRLVNVAAVAGAVVLSFLLRGTWPAARRPLARCRRPAASTSPDPELARPLGGRSAGWDWSVVAASPGPWRWSATSPACPSLDVSFDPPSAPPSGSRLVLRAERSLRRPPEHAARQVPREPSASWPSLTLTTSPSAVRTIW